MTDQRVIFLEQSSMGIFFLTRSGDGFTEIKMKLVGFFFDLNRINIVIWTGQGSKLEKVILEYLMADESSHVAKRKKKNQNHVT